MQASLELSGHPKANVQRVILSGTTLVGRSQECGLQIASASVSRKHCEIRLNGESLSVIDLGSSNGTYIDAERLTAGEERPLPDGCRLNVGGIRFVVHYETAVSDESETGPATAAAATTGDEDAADEVAGDEAIGADEPLLIDEPLELGDDSPATTDKSLSDDAVASEEATLPDDGLPSDDEPLSLTADDEDDVAPLVDEDDVPLAVANEEPALVKGEVSDDEVPLLADEQAVAADETPLVDEAADGESINDEEVETETADATNASGDDEELLDPLDESDGIDYFDDAETTATQDDDVSAEVAEMSGETVDGDEPTLTEDGDEPILGEDDDEPILEADEDQAFAFLTDEDEDAATADSQKQSSDNELRDFLGQFGRD